MKTINIDTMFSEVSSEVRDEFERMIWEDKYKRTSGAFNGSSMIRSRHKKDGVMTNVNHIGTLPMTVTKNGVTVEVPASFFTKGGKIRKGMKAEYDNLFL